MKNRTIFYVIFAVFAVAIITIVSKAGQNTSTSKTTYPNPSTINTSTPSITQEVHMHMTSTPTQGTSSSVTISSFTFSPSTNTVKTGTKVTWTNNDSVGHTVTFSDGTTSPVLQKGDSYVRIFSTTGTYTYKCSIHPSMTGTIIAEK